MVFGLTRPASLKNAMASDEKRLQYYGSLVIPYETEEDVEEYLVHGYTGSVALNKSYKEHKTFDDYYLSVYRDGSLFLYELKKSMGEKVFYEAMREYYQSYCLKTAKGEDFLRVIKAFDDAEKTQRVLDKYIETSD